MSKNEHVNMARKWTRSDKGNFQHVVLQRETVRALKRRKASDLESLNDVVLKLLSSGQTKHVNMSEEDISILQELHAETKQLEASRKRNKRSGKKEHDQAEALQRVLSMLT